MFGVSSYISNAIANPKPKTYWSPTDVINDNRLSAQEKSKMLEEMRQNMNVEGRQMRNGMFFDYRRDQAKWQEIDEARCEIDKEMHQEAQSSYIR